jgi:hypothetical protein
MLGHEACASLAACSMLQAASLYSLALDAYMQGIEGVPRLGEGINPATWMLEVRKCNNDCDLPCPVHCFGLIRSS